MAKGRYKRRIEEQKILHRRTNIYVLKCPHCEKEIEVVDSTQLRERIKGWFHTIFP